MKEYTVKIHAQRVQAVITEEHPSRHCPAIGELNTPHKLYSLSLIELYDRRSWSTCKICRAFIGITAEEAVCPCDYYGEIDAVKRTWIALKEYHKGGENAKDIHT